MDSKSGWKILRKGNFEHTQKWDISELDRNEMWHEFLRIRFMWLRLGFSGRLK
jgi:hypothetical protein